MMKPRLMKEARALFPAFAMTLLLMGFSFVLSFFKAWDDLVAGGFSMVLFALGCAMMGAMVFGQEFQHRTMLLLLSQPVARRTQWFEKMLVLGTAVLTCALVQYLLFHRISPKDANGEDILLIFMVPLGALCTTPYLTLVTRHTFAAVVFSFCLPAFAITFVLGILDRLHWLNDANQNWIISLILAIYFTALYGLGQVKFLRWQVIESQSPEIAIPQKLENSLARPFRKLVPGYTGPIASLVSKELRLQRTNFLFAGIFCAALLLEAVWLVTVNRNTSNSMLPGVTFFFYMAVLPLSIGAVSIAEERNWGVAGWHLTLPASARKQWLVKASVALLMGLVLGLLLPAVIGAVSEPVFHFDMLKAGTEPMGLLLVMALVYLLIVAMTIYASSISSNTLRAILFGIGLLVVFGSCLVMIKYAAVVAFGPNSEGWINGSFMTLAALLSFLLHSIKLDAEPDIFLPLFWIVGLIGSLGLILSFASSNFRKADIKVGRVVVQVLAVLAVLVFLTLVSVVLPEAEHMFIFPNTNEAAGTLSFGK
ncbi:MAG: hypothetical protein JWR19_3169 [Pedosphaera sp.]|nr:hypothetical protein [Pedosphaera sp.]